MVRYLIVVLVCVVVNSVLAQDIIVSEYLNHPGASAELEWTELLVVKDNLNLVGWSVHDYSGDINTRAAGVVFRDIPLWRNLRAGTIIVIDHRLTTPAQRQDSLPGDGYIQLLQSDTRFFQLAGNGIDISQPAEMITVRDATDVEVHTLAHMPASYGTGNPIWANAPAPKVAHVASSQIQADHSVRVTGRTLAAYAAGLGSDSTSIGPRVTVAPPSDPGTGPSKGLPNLIDNAKRLSGQKNVNHLLWRELREPQWSAAPQITLQEVLPEKHTISWTNIIDSYPADNVSGYIILRDSLAFSQFPVDGIRDGKMISAGDRIGSSLVLAVRPTQDGTTFTDQNNVTCGVNYTYRVYGYRYGADDVLKPEETADTTARGRQYNEHVFAQSATIEKPAIPKPVINASRTQVCPGDTVTLSVTSLPDVILYEWTRNGLPAPIPGTTSIAVNQVGTYRLKVTGASGCYAESDPVVISPLPAPSVVISPTGPQSLCTGDTIILAIQSQANSYEILRNGTVVSTQASNRFSITQPGRYAVRIRSSGGCDGVSDEVIVTSPDVRFHFEPASIDFGKLGACETSASGLVTLVNDGDRAITLASVVMPSGFALSAPAPGFVVQPGGRQQITILFAPSGLGITNGTARFVAQPCNVTSTLAMRGERTEATAALNTAEVNFGTTTTCPTSIVRDSSEFVLTNSGQTPITVTPPVVAPPFYISFSSVQLLPGESVPIKVRYIPLGPDLNRSVNQVISFPFTSASCNDTLRASLRAASFHPELSLQTDTVNVGSQIGCSASFQGNLTIVNNGRVPATVTAVESDAGIIVNGLPVTVQPGQTRTVDFVFTVTGVGDVVVHGTLRTEPCGSTMQFVAQSFLLKPTIMPRPTQVVFPDISLCNGPASASIETELEISPTTASDTVLSVSVPLPFSVDLSSGMEITDGQKVLVRCSAVQAGDYAGVIEVVLQCSDTLRIPVQARAVRSTRSVDVSGTDFGTVPFGGWSEQLLTITNTGLEEIVIPQLQGIQPPWSVVSETPALPASLQPGGNVQIVLRYSFDSYNRRDSITLSTASLGSCPDTVLLTFYGATEQEPTTPGKITGVRFELPDNVRGYPGEKVSFFTALTSEVPLAGRGLKEFSTDIEFNGSLFKIVEVISVNPLITISSTGEITPGKLTVQVVANEELVESDRLFQINGLVYLGSDRFSPLKATNVQSPQADILGKDGRIEVLSDCDASTQYIDLGQNPGIVVRSSITTPTEVIIEVVSVTDDPVYLAISDVRGTVMKSTVLHSGHGRHTIYLDVSEWQSGWYVAAYANGITTKSYPFLITR